MAPLIPIAVKLAAFVPSILKMFNGSDKDVALASHVVGIAQAITGTTDQPPEAALEVLNANPDKVLEFRASIAAQQVDMEKAYLVDRQDARDHDVDVRKLNDGHNRRADYMVALDVIGLIACLLVLIFFRQNLPGEVVGILSTIIGIFGACLRDAHQFEFGSSRSSKDKDEIISRMTK